MWFVHRIVKILTKHKSLLPSVECILKSGKDKITVVGWLPCHHSDVGYTLTLKLKADGNSVIESIDDIVKTKKKSSIPTSRNRSYTEKAEQTYNDVALWTVAVMYPILDIFSMDIDAVFQRLTTNIENVCLRDSPHAVYLYRKEKAKEAIQAGLRQMGELPYDDWEGFEARMAWQRETRYDTASKKKPSSHVLNVECYQSLWTTSMEIAKARAVADALTPTTTTLVLGSLSPCFVPRNACILVRNTEDAYRAHCHLEWDYANIYVLQMGVTHQMHPNKAHSNTPKSLGLSLVRELPQDLPHIFVAWSHLWGIEEWLTVIDKNPQSYTCVGRLDQFIAGRGQIFRDMVESQHFPTSIQRHFFTDNVIMVNTESISEFVAEVTAKHGTVQCFAAQSVVCSVDTKRRQLFNPTRIRSLRDPSSTPDIKLPRLPLYEEYCTTEKCTRVNKSVVPIHSFHGVHVHAAVYICSENTTPFDIHVARTHAREALYVVNCQRNMFAFNKTCRKRTTVHLF